MLTGLFIINIAPVRSVTWLLGVIVAGGQPDYRCLLPAGVLVNETLPPAYNRSLSKCEMYLDNNTTERCTDWEYLGDIGHTIVSQVKRAPAVTWLLVYILCIWAVIWPARQKKFSQSQYRQKPIFVGVLLKFNLLFSAFLTGTGCK